MTDSVDWTDPCARAAALRDAYYRILSGGGEIEIQTRSLDALDKVRFQPADLTALRGEWQDAEDACAAALAGKAPVNTNRFAITARFKRSRNASPWNGGRF